MPATLARPGRRGTARGRNLGPSTWQPHPSLGPYISPPGAALFPATPRTLTPPGFAPLTPVAYHCSTNAHPPINGATPSVSLSVAGSPLPAESNCRAPTRRTSSCRGPHLIPGQGTHDRAAGLRFGTGALIAWAPNCGLTRPIVRGSPGGLNPGASASYRSTLPPGPSALRAGKRHLY